MGYIFVTLFFVHRRSPKLAVFGGSFGILYGALVSTGRVVDGGHFPTDTIWSLGILLLVAGFLYYFVLRIPIAGRGSEWRLSPVQRRWLLYGLPVILAVVAAAFFTRRPFYETYVRDFQVPPETRILQIVMNAPPDRFRVAYGAMGSGRIVVHASGFGWATSSHGLRMEENGATPIGRVILTVEPRGYFSELTHQLEVYLPKALKDTVTVDLQKQP